jgi:D-3-phosphoglycerate dehydrogenase
MSTRKKVVVTFPRAPKGDTLEERYALELEALAPLGVDLIEVNTGDANEFVEAARDAHAVITSWGFPLRGSTISKLETCKVIGVASIGVDMIDVDAATEAGVVVTNTPDIFVEEVADHAMMLLLTMARAAKATNRASQEGIWFEARAIPSAIPRLTGQTLGLLGFGNVARSTARRAKPFGLRIMAYDPYVSEVMMINEGVEPVTFDQLLQHSDYLSVHAALTDETRHMMSAEQFCAMKSSAVIINTARGPIIAETALIRALEDGVIAGLAADVLETEPPARDNPLLVMDNVFITPHTASASARMALETRRRTAREVALVLSGRWPLSCVNPTVLPKTQLKRWQPISMDRGPNG